MAGDSSHVTRHMSHVTCHTSFVTCHMSQLLRLHGPCSQLRQVGFHFTRHTSSIPHHASCVTRHTSHVTCHTLNVPFHMSHITSNSSHVALHFSHFTRHTSHVTRHASRSVYFFDPQPFCAQAIATAGANPNYQPQTPNQSKLTLNKTQTPNL